MGKADRSRKSAENRVRTGERNRRFSLARFFAAFLSLLVRFFRSSTLTESTLTQSQAQAMYCEVFQDQTPFWENRTIPRVAHA